MLNSACTVQTAKLCWQRWKRYPQLQLMLRDPLMVQGTRHSVRLKRRKPA